MKRQNVKECAPRNRIELTEGILLCCTNAIETSAWFMINSTALGPVTHKYKRDLLNSFKFLNSIKKKVSLLRLIEKNTKSQTKCVI
jgi:hypothetical protein